MASGLGTLSLDSMQSTVGFKAESKALGSSVKATKDMQKVVKAEVSSPLEQMTKFFANIDSIFFFNKKNILINASI